MCTVWQAELICLKQTDMHPVMTVQGKKSWVTARFFLVILH